MAAIAGETLADPCVACGATDWEIVPRSPWRRVLDWMQYGRPPVAPGESIRCRRCGASSSASAWGTYALLTAASPWSAPVRVLDALRRRRRAQPVPLVYLMAAAVGLGVGMVLDLALGWPWWGVAIGFPAAVWLGFLSTAISRPAGHALGHDLGTELLQAISPRRACARRERLADEQWRSPPFQLYGLPPSWTGRRFRAGLAASGRRVTCLELGHGALVGPELRVESCAQGGEPEEVRLRRLAVELRDNAERAPASLPLEERARWRSERQRRQPSRAEPEWTEITVPVDGRPVVLRFLSEGPAWVATTDLGEVALTLRGTEFPPGEVELVPITDTAPYGRP